MGLAVTVAATETASYKDKFSSISWGGSDGSLPWSGPWSEIGDDGDEKKGNVRVVSSGNCASDKCLHATALTTLLGPIGVVRTADTSGLLEATLSFDIKTTSSLLGSELDVQVNGGEGWITVADYTWGLELTDHPTIDVSGYSSENFGVRFHFSGPLLGGEVYIDNVEIRGVLAEETTTTTTTIPTTTTPPFTTTTETVPPTTTRSGSSGSSTSTTVAATAVTTVTTTLPGGGPGSDDGERLPDRSGGGADSSEVTPAEPGTDGVLDTPDGSGLRAAARGLQANFDGDLYGEVRAVSSLTAVDVRAEYSMAVEVIRASWGWIVLLALLVGYSIISGLDRSRNPIDAERRLRGHWTSIPNEPGPPAS